MTYKISNLSHLFPLMVLSGMLFCGETEADVYKWTDDDGNVHYSQHPPVDGDAEVIKDPPKVDSAQALRDLRELRIKQQKTEQEESRRNEEAGKKEEYLTTKEDNCNKARDKLLNLQNARMIRALDDQGNVVRATEEEHQARITASKANIDEWCN